jgi:WD40 repeat protein
MGLGVGVFAAVSGDTDRSVRLWTLPDNFIGGILDLPGVGLRDLLVGAVTEGLIVVAAVGEVLQIWDPRAQWPPGDELGTHPGGAYAVALDGDTAASGGGDGALRFWNVVDGSVPADPVHLLTSGRVRAVAAAHGRIVAGGDDGVVSLVTLDAGGVSARIELGRHDGDVLAVALVDDFAVSGGLDGVARIFDLTGARGHRVLVHQWSEAARYSYADRDRASPIALAVSELDGRPVIVTGADDTMVRIWDVATGKLACDPLVGHKGPVTAIAAAMMRGRPIVLSGDEFGTVRAWDLGWRTSPPIGPWARFTGSDLPDPRP